MSLRRPTLACPLFTFNISPLCDVASDARLRHALSFIFCYKPFMWCRPDARLWQYYSCSFLSRSHSDPRLAPVLLFCSFRSRRHSDPRLAPSIYSGISGGLPPDFSVISPCIIVSMSERTCFSVLMLHVYICYILCPNCLASTFMVLNWLVDLARC